MQHHRSDDQELNLHESGALASMVEMLTARRGRIRMNRKRTNGLAPKPKKPRARKAAVRYKRNSLLSGSPQYK